MVEEDIRCRYCETLIEGAALDESLGEGAAVVCPTCGLEVLPRRPDLPHRARSRCRRCGYRIPVEAAVCPKCGYRRVPLMASVRSVLLRVTAVVSGLVLLACIGWVGLRTIQTNAIPRLLGLAQTPRSPTPEVVYVVATQPLPLPTLDLPPTLEPVVLVTPSPTRRGAPTVTPTRRGAPTITPLPITLTTSLLFTPTPAAYAAPQVMAPENGAVFNGADAKITLEWQPVTSAGLSESEWYMISLTYTGRDSKPAEQVGWSREPRWTVSKEWWSQAAPNARTFQWQVTATRIEGVDPFSSPSRTPISPPSSSRIFIWN